MSSHFNIFFFFEAAVNPMEIRTTKILLFPLPNITNELGYLITIPNDYNWLAWLHIAEEFVDGWPSVHKLFQNPEPQFLGRNTPTQFSVPSLAKYYSRRNTWFTNLPTYLPFSLHWTTIHVGILHCRINSVNWAYEKILSPCCSIVFSGNLSWTRNCSSYSCLSPVGFQFAGLLEEVLGSALKKLNEAHSVRDHHTRACLLYTSDAADE